MHVMHVVWLLKLLIFNNLANIQNETHTINI